MFVHRYDTTVCPNCGADLTQADQVRMILSMGGQLVSIMTRLGADGLLIDVDRSIANGYHSDTECGMCGERLTDHEVDPDSRELT
jgi:hypothetical protein